MPLARLAWLPMLLCLGFTAKLLVIMERGPEGGSATAWLALALGCAALSAWLLRLEQRNAPAPGRSAEAHTAPGALPSRPAAHPAERRRHPRRPVSQPVEIAWHDAGRELARLQDLSRGGARIREAEAAPVGRRGLLQVPGLSLPVPFTVVACQPETGLHIRFDLEGMGLEAMEMQLDQLLNRTGRAMAATPAG